MERARRLMNQRKEQKAKEETDKERNMDQTLEEESDGVS